MNGAEQLAKWKARHRQPLVNPCCGEETLHFRDCDRSSCTKLLSGYCAACDFNWPCPTARLIAQVEELRERADTILTIYRRFPQGDGYLAMQEFRALESALSLSKLVEGAPKEGE